MGQKTKDIFLMTKDNLHKPCIFEISVKVFASVKPKCILLNYKNSNDKETSFKRKALTFP